MRVGVTPVEELDDLEAAFVDVEVDVALLEIRRVCRPDLRLGIPGLDRAPGVLADAATFDARHHEEQVQ